MLDAQIPCTGIRPAQVGIDRCDRARSAIRCGAERRIAADGTAAREHGTGNTPIHARCELNGSSRDIAATWRSEEHTSELQSRLHLVCRLLLEKKKKKIDLTT